MAVGRLGCVECVPVGFLRGFLLLLLLWERLGLRCLETGVFPLDTGGEADDGVTVGGSCFGDWVVAEAGGWLLLVLLVVSVVLRKEEGSAEDITQSRAPTLPAAGSDALTTVT